MFAIQERIQTFSHEAEDVQQVIERGSDEHLDIIGEFTSIVGSLTSKLASLNKDLSREFNTMSAESIATCMPDLKELYSILLNFKTVIRKSVFFRDVPSCCRTFFAHVEDLREIIYDLQNFRLQQDDLDDLMMHLNDL